MTVGMLPEDSPARAAVKLGFVTKVYEPFPPLLRAFVRTPLRNPVTALDDVSLSLSTGEICALVGPNGAGKTTLFRILVGLTTPTRGQVDVLGHDPVTQSREVRRIVGWLPADDRSSFLMRHTCYENLYFHGRLQAMGRELLRDRIPEVLREMGVAHVAHQAVFTLSTGMRARLKLARALLHEPRVLILDEPTGAVDPVAAHELLELVRALVRQRDLAALISSHRLEEIEALSSRVVLLDRGLIVYDGHLDTLRRRFERQILTLAFDRGETASHATELLTRSGMEVDLIGSEVRVAIAPGATSGSVLGVLGPVGDRLVHVHESPIPLRDLLARIYRRQKVGAEAEA